jgi:hypothetical protein
VTFTLLHIGLTALACGIAGALISWVWLRPCSIWAALGAGVLAGFATLGWRTVANTGAFNNDGVSGFSPNDLLAPVVTYVLLAALPAIRPALRGSRFDQTRFFTTIAALAVNVIGI